MAAAGFTCKGFHRPIHAYNVLKFCPDGAERPARTTAVGIYLPDDPEGILWGSRRTVLIPTVLAEGEAQAIPCGDDETGDIKWSCQTWSEFIRCPRPLLPRSRRMGCHSLLTESESTYVD